MTCYSNPVIPGTHPDPSVCRVGEDYYLANSSFAYFPGVPIFHSRDLVNWRQIGHALTRASQLPLEQVRLSGGIYAPSLRYINGRFYMITTLIGGPEFGSKHLYVWTDDPAGEWSEPIWIDQSGIDPDLFQDTDGRTYFLRNNIFDRDNLPRGLYMGEIDLSSGQMLSDMRMLWTGSGGYEPEGPHLYRINGMYYLMVAENGTYYGHMETIARSREMWGPYESCPHNPILTHRHLNPNPIKCTGHADLIEAHDGSWWLTFLGVRPYMEWGELQHLGRETFLAPVTWTDDGWPVVNGNGTAALTMKAATLPTHPWRPEPTRDDFDSPRLGLSWNFLRNPREGSWSLSERPGWMRLWGNEHTLDSVDAPAFVGRRQEQMDCAARALLDFSPSREGEEAGITTYMSDTHHYEMAITLRGGKRRVILRRRIGDLQAEVASSLLPDGPLELIIHANPTTYTFAYKPADKEETILDTANIQHLSVEMAGVFTGMYIGLYATGNGRASAGPADFDWFELDSRRIVSV